MKRIQLWLNGSRSLSPLACLYTCRPLCQAPSSRNFICCRRTISTALKMDVIVLRFLCPIVANISMISTETEYRSRLCHIWFIQSISTSQRLRIQVLQLRSQGNKLTFLKWNKSSNQHTRSKIDSRKCYCNQKFRWSNCFNDYYTN